MACLSSEPTESGWKGVGKRISEYFSTNTLTGLTFARTLLVTFPET